MNLNIENQPEMKYQNRNDDVWVRCVEIEYLLSIVQNRCSQKCFRHNSKYKCCLVQFDTYTLDLISDNDPFHFCKFFVWKIKSQQTNWDESQMKFEKIKAETKRNEKLRNKLKMRGRNHLEHFFSRILTEHLKCY